MLCKKHELFRIGLAIKPDALGSQTEKQHACRRGVVCWPVFDTLEFQLVSPVFSLTQQYVLFEMFHLVLLVVGKMYRYDSRIRNLSKADCMPVTLVTSVTDPARQRE